VRKLLPLVALLLPLTGQADAICRAKPAVATELIISITHDDTDDNQFTKAAPILESHGMRGTFFVNVSRLIPEGSTYPYLILSEVMAMEAAGHEIGIHGLDHLDQVATTTPLIRMRRELCDSRSEALLFGLHPRAFAYPHGVYDDYARSLAYACGYITARAVGGATGIGSSGPYYESLPPVDAYALRAPSSFAVPASTLVTLQGYVTRAEAAAASAGKVGWLIMNFHNVCDSGTLCPGGQTDNIIDTATYTAFFDWLQPRAASGTIVQTISQAWGGPLKPAVSSGTPPLILGDMESYLAGATAAPDGWYRYSSGTGTGTWSRVTGLSGIGYAQQVVLSGWASGGMQALLQDYSDRDYRSATTQVTPGRSYTLSCSYRSDVPVRFHVWHRNSTIGSWVTLLTTSTFPASPSSVAQASYTLTAPGSGYIDRTLDFGLEIASVCSSGCLNGNSTGTMIVDDCNVTDNGP
jgi:peptidoglycan/xylan/chitin deacetylase (PgdA/CDA1 family)